MRVKRENIKKEKRVRRHRKIRTRLLGTKDRPRLSISKSNRFISAQLIDDTVGKTIASATTKGSKEKAPLKQAEELGKAIAKLARSEEHTS